jgi:nicotinate-nucleotide adenylyltransferase
VAAKRVGVFGGTFDPPHLGHLLLAETIREQFRLDEVLFVPCNEPPLKDRADLTGATHRYAMVVAATLHNPSFSPSAVEVNRPGTSYSIDTIRMLAEEYGSDAELFFVAGLDSMLQLESWREPEALLSACNIVVVSRPGSNFDELADALPEGFAEQIVDAREGNAVPDDAPSPAIYLSDAVYFSMSSTELRARVRAGLGIRYRVTPEVERYVQSHGLYQATPDEAES